MLCRVIPVDTGVYFEEYSETIAFTMDFILRKYCNKLRKGCGVCDRVAIVAAGQKSGRTEGCDRRERERERERRKLTAARSAAAQMLCLRRDRSRKLTHRAFDLVCSVK